MKLFSILLILACINTYKAQNKEPNRVVCAPLVSISVDTENTIDNIIMSDATPLVSEKFLNSQSQKLVLVPININNATNSVEKKLITSDAKPIIGQSYIESQSSHLKLVISSVDSTQLKQQSIQSPR